jgi:hypothetical protein
MDDISGILEFRYLFLVAIERQAVYKIYDSSFDAGHPGY